MTFTPHDAEVWRAHAEAMRESLSGTLTRLVAHHDTPEGSYRITVTAGSAKLRLPDGTKLELEEWLRAAS